MGDSTNQLSSIFERLSSGQRINRASDDAASLSVALTLNTNSRLFTKANQNVNDAISYLSIGEGALSSLGEITTRLSELATQASNGTFSHTQRASMNSESTALVDEYNRIIATTSFNGVKILDGTSPLLTVQAGESGSDVNQTLSIRVGTDIDRAVGTGTLGSELTIAGAAGQDLTTGDFNGDSKIDIINAAGTVYLGNGDGTFRQGTSLNVSWNYITMADTNGDGKIDIIGGNGSTARVLLGNGDGTFVAAQTFTGAGTVGRLTLGDLNGDGIADLVLPATNVATVSVLFGNGNGTFQAKVDYSVSGSPGAATLADMNDDGRLDIVTGGKTGSTVNILINQGNGTFASAVSYNNTGATVTAISTSDYNNDGYADISIADGNGKLSVLLGNGDGTLSAARSFTGNGAQLNDIETVDINGDGKADIVGAVQTATVGLQSTFVWIGNGDGTFVAAKSFANGARPNSIAVGDFNGDGVQDVTVAGDSAGSGVAGVRVLLSNATTTNYLPIINLASQASARTSLETIAAARDRINLELGDFGANQSRLRIASNTLYSSKINTDAAYSRIMDADVAQESANLIRTRILNQAAAAILSQANQIPQIALKLITG